MLTLVGDPGCVPARRVDRQGRSLRITSGKPAGLPVFVETFVAELAKATG
ncbi:hypothetical protein [Kitasatospora sp. NPDC050543]